MTDCCLQCQCDLCLNGHTTPLDGPPLRQDAIGDVRKLRTTARTPKAAKALRREARAIQNRGQQYKRRAERQAARFYDAAHRIDGKGKLWKQERGGRLQRESFDPSEPVDMVIAAAEGLTEKQLRALERRNAG